MPQVHALHDDESRELLHSEEETSRGKRRCGGWIICVVCNRIKEVSDKEESIFCDSMTNENEEQCELGKRHVVHAQIYNTCSVH